MTPSTAVRMAREAGFRMFWDSHLRLWVLIKGLEAGGIAGTPDYVPSTMIRKMSSEQFKRAYLG